MDDPISKDVELDPKDAAGLTLLRRLVTGLLGVMIVGFLVLIGFLVTRFPDFEETGTNTGPALSWPETLDLPEGVTPEAVTRGSDWVAVVAGDEILIFEAATGALRQRIAVETPSD
ncbi:hypothetical protein HCZ23_02045 [Celeribacter sp. HF31]|uniref:DUF6476 family protein n=1 Tax=Celeribacter sp. HF31 TaxID=2721558 RepID=UPI0014310DC8|nr:DUF6476 family protein [Celeribacter sp. HF31]NIY78251.1 hypothetical protein [Celeribacter sp. HF31]